MQIYVVSVSRFTTTHDFELHYKARALYKQLSKRTKRRPYVRSAYFRNEKVFLDIFWSHLYEKNWRDRNRRLRYFPCAIDLIEHSKYSPISKENPNKRNELLHRFTGVTKDGHYFYVQIKEHRKTGQKFLLSIFPEQTQKTFR